MNKTIALPDVATRVAEIAGVDTETASRFILGLFSAVEQDIVAGNRAEIAGIGTFSRGDNGTVLFTPAAELADAVNAPFALFTPVSIPADAPVNIFNAEDEYHPQDKAEVPAGAMEPPEFVMPAEAPAKAPEQHTPAPEPEPEQQPNHTTEEPAHEEVATEATATVDTLSETGPEPQYIYVERRSAWPWIAAILCLLVGFAAGFCYGKHGCIFFFHEPMVQPEPLETVAVPADTVPVDTVASAVEPESAGPDTVDAVPESAEPVAEEPVYDTVGTTRFLTTIARDHYGRKDYWVFIYDANAAHLPHPNRIHPGTRVLVPSLGPNAATDSATRARARQLANEIYRRYDL